MNPVFDCVMVECRLAFWSGMPPIAERRNTFDNIWKKPQPAFFLNDLDTMVVEITVARIL